MRPFSHSDCKSLPLNTLWIRTKNEGVTPQRRNKERRCDPQHRTSIGLPRRDPRPTCGASHRAAARLAAVATPPATRRRASPQLQRLPPHGGAPRRSCNASRHTAARLAAVATPPATRRRASPQLQRLPPHGGAPRRSCNASRHTAAPLAAVATPPATRWRASPPWQRVPPHGGAPRRRSSVSLRL